LGQYTVLRNPNFRRRLRVSVVSKESVRFSLRLR
jgi:hypothetical protein